jgi:hypothetical protein
MATSLQRGYEDPRWMTYMQASEKGVASSTRREGKQIE